MSIEDFVSKTQTSIDGLGFLFGAGTSFESGYPLVSGLTTQVIDALDSVNRATLDSILEASGNPYNPETGTPNIEEIADLVVQHHLESNQDNSATLKGKLRELVRDAILGVTEPDISNQVSFFEALQRRSFNRPTKIWVFTTNYDLLFEDAATQAGVNLVNGFSGAISRFFNEKEFALARGIVRPAHFTEDSSLTINLVKLHGSVSWHQQDSRVFETHPQSIGAGQERCMVLPRRSKVMETLAPPYDRLFRLTSNVLGSKCQYLISSGFSFGDDHINDALVRPSIENGQIALTNFCGAEPENLSSVRARPNVTHICSDKKVVGGRETIENCDLWKFSEFVNLF